MYLNKENYKTYALQSVVIKLTLLLTRPVIAQLVFEIIRSFANILFDVIDFDVAQRFFTDKALYCFTLPCDFFLHISVKFKSI